MPRLRLMLLAFAASAVLAPPATAGLTPASCATRFDIPGAQRGTGRSDYLDCDVALTPTYYVPAGESAQQLAKTVQRCASRLGPARAFYTTRETVDDLEALRQAMGYDKLDLIGVSYGTRGAM